VEYWLANPSIWPQSEFVIGPDIFSKDAALVIMSANPQGDATYILAGQYITAQLNIASPADPTAILEEMALVKDWFINHPLGSAPQNPERKVGLGYAKTLEEYNLGQLGLGRCQVPTPTPTATVTITPTPESSWTPTQAPTMEPTGLPPATETPTPELPTEASP
jgi:hypothetical protein